MDQDLHDRSTRVGPGETACTLATMECVLFIIDMQATLPQTEPTLLHVSQADLIQMMDAANIQAVNVRQRN